VDWDAVARIMDGYGLILDDHANPDGGTVGAKLVDTVCS
jgi:hypothetical protein